MKKFIIFIFISLIIFSCSLLAQQITFPSPTGYVNDYVGILSSEIKSGLEDFIHSVEEKTTAQIAVVITDSTEPYDIELYAVKLFEKWGIGQKGKDNGVLLLIAVKDRKMRIEVGYGLEGVLTDAKCGRIIRDIIAPNFKNNDFNTGVSAGVESIIREVLKEYNLTISDLQTAYKPQCEDGCEYEHSTQPIPIKSKIFLIIFGLIMLMIFIKNPWLFLLLFFPGSRRYRGGGWSGGSWGGSSGGFGGGFGGFGGGMSGGGGASGGW